MRNHPIISSRPTTYKELAKKLGCGIDAARSRYKKLSALGPVTLHAMKEVDRIRRARERRDARILEAAKRGSALTYIATKHGNGVSIQRVHQVINGN